MSLEVLDRQSAPEDARPLLEKAERHYGFVPNILGVMANAPALLEGYMTLTGIFAKTSFSSDEQQVVLLAAAIENGCEYCKAAHLAMAEQQGVDADVLDAVRAGRQIPDERLRALWTFTRVMVEKRGHPDAGDLRGFLEAGYGEAQIQEVILGVGLKILSNYNNHVAGTPLDEQFES
ncbi:MAG: carboxymuconolactone decarboxylase family protein [Wenzhouxiangellaceae bacterium]|nr:carboxymuconolactone decarboxylase family protein [Wenzhouxiangellaceae bacterium]